MTKEKMTVVFTVKDREAMKQLYDAHKNGGLICGMSPNIIAWGDQVTKPGEIVEGLAELDPAYPNIKELKELCEMAEKHAKGEE